MGSSIMRKAGEMASANAIWARRCLPADSSGIGLAQGRMEDAFAGLANTIFPNGASESGVSLPRKLR